MNGDGFADVLVGAPGFNGGRGAIYCVSGAFLANGAGGQMLWSLAPALIGDIGATRDVPVVKNGALGPGKRCAVTLSCDHRVVDGAMGARFLQGLRGLVERPLSILA